MDPPLPPLRGLHVSLRVRRDQEDDGPQAGGHARGQAPIALGVCKRTAVELPILGQTLRHTGTVHRWVSSERQVADGLTKVSALQLLAEKLQKQTHCLACDASFTAAKRKDTEAQRKSEKEGVIEPLFVTMGGPFCPNPVQQFPTRSARFVDAWTWTRSVQECKDIRVAQAKGRVFMSKSYCACYATILLIAETLKTSVSHASLSSMLHSVKLPKNDRNSLWQPVNGGDRRQYISNIMKRKPCHTARRLRLAELLFCCRSVCEVLAMHTPCQLAKLFSSSFCHCVSLLPVVVTRLRLFLWLSLSPARPFESVLFRLSLVKPCVLACAFLSDPSCFLKIHAHAQGFFALPKSYNLQSKPAKIVHLEFSHIHHSYRSMSSCPVSTEAHALVS